MEIFGDIPILGFGLDARQETVFRHGHGDDIHRVVQAADDDWPVGVAVLEGHHHLVAAAGPKECAVTLSGPTLGHSDPAGGSRLVFRCVPPETDLNTAELVKVGLLPWGPRDDGRLNGTDARFGHGRPRLLVVDRRHRLETVGIGDIELFTAPEETLLLAMVLQAGDQPQTVCIGMVVQFELMPGDQIHAVAMPLRDDRLAGGRCGKAVGPAG